MFESDGERRTFLSLLARQVRLGRIEVLSFALMSNHYHLLVRSPAGRLGQAMQELQSTYSRRFNAARDRDGPLVKGRYFSSVVASAEYLWTVIRYIDDNVVKAGLGARASDYPFCSAAAYAKRRGPAWLSRELVEEAVRGSPDAPGYDPARYAQVFPSALPEEVAAVVEARLQRHVSPLERAVPELPSAADDEDGDVAWLARRTVLADGRRRLRVVTSAGAVLEGLRVDLPHAQVLATSLLRLAAGLSFVEIARRLGVSVQSAHRRWRRHRLLLTDPAYVEVLSAQLRRALGRTYVRVEVADAAAIMRGDESRYGSA